MTILITGGTGKTGSRVAQALTDLGHPIRVATRHSAPPFDWNDQTTWDDVLEGCSAAYVTFQPDLALPGADEIIAEFARTAVARGCRRLVLLSGRGEEGAAEPNSRSLSPAPTGPSSARRSSCRTSPRRSSLTRSRTGR